MFFPAAHYTIALPIASWPFMKGHPAVNAERALRWIYKIGLYLCGPLPIHRNINPKTQAMISSAFVGIINKACMSILTPPP